MTERSLVLIKPDGVQRLLVGRVIARLEDKGLKLVGLKLVHVDRAFAEQHYAVHRERPFFAGLVDFITSSPLVALAVEGPNAIPVVRSMVGATRPWEAAPGTIRGDFAVVVAQNLIHASDGPETAATELALWFPEGLVDYSPRRRSLGALAGRLTGRRRVTCTDSTAGAPSAEWRGRCPARGSARATARGRPWRGPRRAGPASRRLRRC